MKETKTVIKKWLRLPLFWLAVFSGVIGTAYSGKGKPATAADRTIKFYSQSIDKRDLERYIFLPNADYCLFQNTLKDGGWLLNAREEYDLVVYVYDALAGGKDTLLTKTPVRLTRFTGGPQSVIIKSKQPFNSSIYRVEIDSLKSIMSKRWAEASSLIFQPRIFQENTNHIMYTVSPDILQLGLLSAEEVSLLAAGVYRDKNNNKLSLNVDVALLNPSPPRKPSAPATDQ